MFTLTFDGKSEDMFGEHAFRRSAIEPKAQHQCHSKSSQSGMCAFKKVKIQNPKNIG